MSEHLERACALFAEHHRNIDAHAAEAARRVAEAERLAEEEAAQRVGYTQPATNNNGG